MTRRRIPCTLSSRVIGPSSHRGSLGRVSTLGKIGQMALPFVHGKCQHYYESGHTRGVGKSRLVYEGTHSHRLQGWQVLEAASVSYGKPTSYLPVIDLLKGYFKIPRLISICHAALRVARSQSTPNASRRLCTRRSDMAKRVATTRRVLLGAKNSRPRAATSRGNDGVLRQRIN